MINPFEEVADRYLLASAEFARRLALVGADQWAWPTPCPAWNVRHLVNHMAGGNLNYVRLLEGASAAEFLRLRDADVLGEDPVVAYADSVRACAAAFAGEGALRRVLDYPLGTVTGQQALAVRTTDSLIHAWDLARAIGADECLAPDLVGWVSDHLGEIYAGLAEAPGAAQTTNRFFAPSIEEHPGKTSTRQDELLRRMGRHPAAGS